MRLFRRLVFFLAALFASLPAIAQEAAPPGAPPSGPSPVEWFIRGSLLFFPEDNGSASAPMPILPSLGGGVSYAINNLLAIEASLDFYGTTYDYDYSLNRPVPANDEYRSAYIIGAGLGLQSVFRFRPMENKFTIRAYIGPAFDFRIVLQAYGIDDDEQHSNNPGSGIKTVGQAREDINSYFWGNGRFFFFSVGGGMDFPVFNAIKLGFDLRAWFPVWRLWTGEDLPAIEGWRFGGGFKISF